MSESPYVGYLKHQADDQLLIEQLQAENARLRAAARELSSAVRAPAHGPDVMYLDWARRVETAAAVIDGLVERGNE